MSDNSVDSTAVQDAAQQADFAPVDDTAAAQVEDTDGAADDVFPREVVEKLRRESAGYRDRAKAAEGRLTAMQCQSVDAQITAAGMRPAAVWATAQLDELLADNGAVDAGKVSAAMAAAREALGIGRHRPPHPGQGELNSGATGAAQHAPGPGFAAAFGPRRK